MKVAVAGALLVVAAALLPGCGESIRTADPSPWQGLGECQVKLWEASHEQSSNSGLSVSFADADHGWLTVFDRTGGVWESSDGGATWALSEGRILGDRGQGDFTLPEQVGQLQWPYRIACVDEETVWLVFKAPFYKNPESVPSQAGGVLISHDGGATWRRCLALDGPVGHELIGSCSFVDADHGWLIVAHRGGGGENGVFLLRTKDGGRSWQRSKLGDYDNRQYDAMLGYILEQSVSWVPSTEEGLVWEPTGGPGSALRETWPGQKLAYWPVGEVVEFADPWAEILRSTDGCRTWKSVLKLDDTWPLSSVYFVDEQNGWVGGDGLILATHDGGGDGTDESSWERELVLEEADEVRFLHFCRVGDSIIAAGWEFWESEENGGVVRFYRRDVPKAGGEAAE